MINLSNDILLQGLSHIAQGLITIISGLQPVIPQDVIDKANAIMADCHKNSVSSGEVSADPAPSRIGNLVEELAEDPAPSKVEKPIKGKAVKSAKDLTSAELLNKIQLVNIKLFSEDTSDFHEEIDVKVSELYAAHNSLVVTDLPEEHLPEILKTLTQMLEEYKMKEKPVETVLEVKVEEDMFGETADIVEEPVTVEDLMKLAKSFIDKKVHLDFEERATHLRNLLTNKDGEVTKISSLPETEYATVAKGLKAYG